MMTQDRVIESSSSDFFSDTGEGAITSIIARLWIKIILIFSGHFWLLSMSYTIDQSNCLSCQE